MPCDRYTQEGLSVFPMTPGRVEHLSTCDECRALSERYARLERLIARAHALAEPPAGWEDRLEEAILGWRPKARWPRRLALVAGVAAAGLASVLVLRPARQEASLSATVELPTGMRSTTAAIGARYRVEAKAWREVRVWLNRRTLVGRCPGGAGCEEGGSGLRLTVPLSVEGEYRVMALEPGTGEALSEPVSLDEDARQVRQRQGRYEVLEPVSAY
jgi:hypothetical protein